MIMRAHGGDFGDSVLLSPSVRERTVNGRDRLPLFIRQALWNRGGIRVFNPRGRSLGDITEVQQLLGLALHCIDPNSTILNSIPQTSMAQGVRTSLNAWRQRAMQFIATNPVPGGLAAFVQGWRTRTPTTPTMQQWPREWPLLDLIFTLTTWFPFLHQDPEGQVYLEAVTRTVSEVGQMASYGAQLLHGAGGHHDTSSIREVIREVFESVATGSVEIDEEIMPHVPRSYFPIMTVYQAKGLEFPLVIVDVGSDYRTDHHAQRRFRFPVEGDDVHVTEDVVATYSPIGGLRTQRVAVDRAWDDLRRLFFVAYSRPENVLLLVGLVSQLRQQTPVSCIALGDIRQGGRGLTFVPANQWTPTLGPGTVALI
jgi:DNA helicase-2/ATP-dependent DNA helicase PcrA